MMKRGILFPNDLYMHARRGSAQSHFFLAGAAFFALDAFGAAAFFAIAMRGGRRGAKAVRKLIRGEQPVAEPRHTGDLARRGGGITARRRSWSS